MSELSVKLGPTNTTVGSTESSAGKGKSGQHTNSASSKSGRQEYEIDLTRRLKRGDESAMNELIGHYGETLGLLVGRLTGWHTDREDILQDVLLAVWKQAGSFRGVGPLEGWLKRVAINRCRNHFRTTQSIKRMIERFALLRPPANSTASRANEPEHESLTNCLQKLTQPDRTVLVLFYLEEMPGEEVASVLNIKLETLHVRLHRARKKLKRLLESDNANLSK